MDIAVGLLNPIPRTSGDLQLAWARHAEELGFTALATIDRIAYPSYESMTVLAAVAAVTHRVTLATNVVLLPTRDPVVLAKEAATVDQISGGRLRLGLGVGARPDDFEAVGRPFERRGRLADEALEIMLAAWRGEPVAGSPVAVCPPPVRPEGIPLYFGGRRPAALRRMARHGTGWTASGGVTRKDLPQVLEEVREAWRAGGREGLPKTSALVYFGLGEDVERRAWYIPDYYGQTGPRMLERMPKTAEAVRETIGFYQAAGIDEVVFDPTIADLDQLDRLAEAALRS